MKKHSIIFLGFAFILGLLLIGCGSEDKKPDSEKVEHYSMIITPSRGHVFKSGEDFKMEVSLAEVPDNFKKIVFKLDNQEIFSSDELLESFSTDINTSGLTMGVHNLSSELHFTSGDPEINTVAVLITSDIVPANYSYLIRNKYPHDINAYTQGLEFADGILYEGTGLNGKSDIRITDWRTGAVLKKTPIAEQYFGEGITIIGDYLYQLTYQSNVGFVYDRKTGQKIKEFSYATEGWGLTHDAEHLIMSNGTNKLFFLDKETFERVKEIEVYDNVGPVTMINELEMIEGEIWANIYLSQEIIKIDPATGKVTGIINCSGIFDPNSVNHKTDVLNGIAYDAETKKIYLTGKLWPNLFEVEILNEE